MDAKLKQDLDHFCHVYWQSTEEILQQGLPSPVSRVMTNKLQEEFDLFRLSLYRRIEETLRG